MVMRYQPQGLLRINQGHPLAAGLRLAILPGVNRGFDVAGLRNTKPSGMKQGSSPSGLAAGFGPTSGAGTADKIVTGLSGAFPSTGRTYFFRARKNGPGGGSLGRLFDKTNGTTGQYFYVNATTIAYTEYWSGAERTINTTAPANGAWFDVVVTATYSGSMRTSYMWINGVYATGEGPISAGTFTDAPNTPITIGNRDADNARNLDGSIECAYFWDRILSQDEIASLSNNRYQFLAAPYDDEDVIVAQAQTGISGALSNTFDNVSLSAAGQLDNLGPISSSLSGATMGASGMVGSAVSGALSATMGDVLLSASGIQTNLGSVSSTLAGITMAAQGVPAQNATGSLTPPLGDVTMNASGYQGAQAPRATTIYRRRAPHRLAN